MLTCNEIIKEIYTTQLNTRLFTSITNYSLHFEIDQSVLKDINNRVQDDQSVLKDLNNRVHPEKFSIQVS